MENKSQLWKASVNKAYYGFLTYTLLGGVVGAIVSLVSGAAGIASLVSGGGGGALAGPIIVGILALAGYVYYFLGIKGMKESAAETVLGQGTAQLYKGALLGLIGAGVALIPFIGFIGAILKIVGFVFMMMGFNVIRKIALNEQAAKGAQQLWIMMILSLVAVAINIIPLVGAVISMLINIAVLVFAFLGWRNFSNSELGTCEEDK